MRFLSGQNLCCSLNKSTSICNHAFFIIKKKVSQINEDGGIVDNYCLNFLFIKDSYEKKNTTLEFIISKTNF